MQLKYLFFIPLFILTALGSSVADIEHDIDVLSGHVTTLDNQMTSFSSSSGLAGALAIHTSITTVDSDIKHCISDVKALTPPLPISEIDASAIVEKLEDMLSIMAHFLHEASVKMSQFQVVGLTAIIKSDLNTLRADTLALIQALTGDMPITIQPQLSSLSSQIDADFATAIQA